MRQIRNFLFLMLASSIVLAQTAQVPVEANVSWTLPTTTVDGTPLTGGNALTKVQVWAAPAAIPDNAGGSPSVELGAAATTWKYTTTAPNGSTLYFRAKACNVGGCSNFSPQATRAVSVSVPGVPSGVQVTITVTVSTQ